MTTSTQLLHIDVVSKRSTGNGDSSICNPAASVDGATFVSESFNSTVTHTTADDGSISVASAAIRSRKKASVHKRFSDDTLPSEALMQPLDLQSIPLVGREKEVSQLKACYTRLIETPEEKQLVLIPGLSGAGKSAVAYTLEKEVSAHPGVMFVTGKFDMNTSNEPFSGICRAIGSLCQNITESSSEIICKVQAGINEQLGSDVDLLIQLIPELKELVPDTINDQTVTDIGEDELESKMERLRFAFRILTRVFNSVFSPLVLFLDDLQWADISSLQILEFLISDTQNENSLMIMGCYRSDEVDENSLLHNKMVGLEDMAEKYKFHMTKIPVGAFGLNEIEKVISHVLPNPNVAATLGLAKICRKRTLGNPFFVLEFLKMLYYEGLVKSDEASKIWTWDVDKVDAETMSTANVVVMLHNRLTKLPVQVQSLLQCAAYLGSHFAESTIDLVWTTYGRRLVEARLQPTSALMEIIVREEIVEKCDNSQYRWVHDKLQEAALSLTGQRRQDFQLDIGRTLYYGLGQGQVEEELFTIVDLINSGNLLKLPEFARANLRAAEKARDLSAFQSAAEYTSHALSLLKEDKWSMERDLTLKLYTMGAEMEAILGNADAFNRYTAEVFNQTDLTPMETLPLKIAKASIIGSTDMKFDESVKCYLRLLGELGCRVTWARRLVPVQAIVKLMRIVKRAKALPQSFYDTLVPIEDPRQKAIASVFSKLVYYSFIAGDMLLYTLTICRLAEMTLDHGINEFSAKSFASVGATLVIVMQDFESAAKLNKIALSMLKKFRGMHACETTFLACCPGQSWEKPFEELRATVGNSVVEGLRAGDCEFAMWNLLSSKLTMAYTMAQVMWQMLLNLQGTTGVGNNNPAKLEGEIFSASKDEAETKEKTNAQISFVLFAQSELALFNNGNNYEAAAQRALKLGDEYWRLIPAYLLNMLEVFHRAVPLFAAARRTKKRKFRAEAKRLLKRMDKWAKAGNPNVQYYFLFLTAENLSLDMKRYDAAEEKYKDAIAGVTAAGHLHHLGLIHERYGDFLMEERSDEKKAKEYWKKSLQYYKEWGGEVKVRQLESKLV